MASKRKFSSLSEPGCLEYVKRQENIVNNLQLAWSIINDLVGYSMIAAIIWYGLSHGYWGSKRMDIFCIAAAVYFASKYIYRPIFANATSYEISSFNGNGQFTSVYGCGEVLYGRFQGGNVCYCFLSILYIPLIPIGRYSLYTNRKMIQIDSKAFNETYFCTKLKMCWYEMLYIYLKNWSFATMAFIAFDVFMRDWFLPFVEASSAGATVAY